MKISYHFISNNEMHKKLVKFNKNNNLSMSKTLTLIINNLIPIIDIYTYFANESNEFNYKIIDANIDIRFKIEKKLYRKLKNVHGVMQSYSIVPIISGSEK
jgi:hypothetical protein